MGKKIKKTKLDKGNTLFKIDEDDLVNEWKKHPKMFFKYSVMLPDVQKELDEANAKLDVVKAELDEKIRETPEAYNLPKTTETCISNAILRQPEVIEQQEVVRNLKHKVDVVKAYIYALQHKRDALKYMVELHGQQYFATPAVDATKHGREGFDGMRKMGARGKPKRMTTPKGKK